jgi:hypothetical protein
MRFTTRSADASSLGSDARTARVCGRSGGKPPRAGLAKQAAGRLGGQTEPNDRFQQPSDDEIRDRIGDNSIAGSAVFVAESRARVTACRIAAIPGLGNDSRGQPRSHDRVVADALVRCALPERRKQSSGGTVADVCLWANRQAARSPIPALPARLLPR